MSAVMPSVMRVDQGGMPQPASSLPVLRPYQLATIDRARASLRAMPKGERRLMVQLATGAGKTYTAAELVSKVERQGKRTLFVVDSLELLEQAVSAFDSYGLRVAVMQSKHERTNHTRPTQVCSQATLRGMLLRGELDDYQVDLIVVDEAHMVYQTRDMLAGRWPSAPVIGLSATPFSKGLGDFYGDVVSAISMSDLIAQGYLSPFRVFAPSMPDMKGVKTSGKDWATGAAADRYDNALHASIVDTWLRLARGRRTLMFACTVTHSRKLVADFVAAGVNAVHVDGYPDDPESDEARDRFEKIAAYRRGEIEILSSVTMCTKGFDSPETSALIIARPTKSLSLHWQMLGRALRTAPGKTDALILDHSPNTLRHGFPTDPIDFTLDDSTRAEPKKDAREKGDKLPIPCSACHFMKPAGVFKCPSCGHMPERGHQVKNVDGELVELNPKKPATSRGVDAPPAIKQQWYSELNGYAAEKGKADAWVLAKFRARFHEWPRGLRDASVPPSVEVSGWVQQQNIAYANRRTSA